MEAMNLIELEVLRGMPGTSGPKLHGRTGAHQYLGSEYLADHETLTDAIRAFNLPNAVPPSDWPHVHGNIEARVQSFNNRELGRLL